MSIIELILLGIGLAMDCFAVSLSKGIAAKRFIPAGMVTMAVFFGLFQAGMPLIGYFAGTYFAGFISKTAPWIALVLLGFIGGKMVKEHFCPEEEDQSSADYGFKTIVILAIATSIDALATGLLFVSEPRMTLWLAVGIIGVCSVLFSLLGTTIGVTLGKRFHFPAELVGGLILIGIGLKIWIEGIFL